MKPEEINRRIAIACEWTWDDDNLFWISPDKSFGIADPLNYHGDLNAMHEAEKVLTSREHWEEYLDQIDYDYCATAAQRAKAFLRTIGQWEEEWKMPKAGSVTESAFRRTMRMNKTSF